jgi:PAS domain S-box-containing protein
MASGRKRSQHPVAVPTPPDDYRDLLARLRMRRQELAQRHASFLDSQRRLELSRHEYAELFDFGPLPSFLIDGNGVVRRSNLATAELLVIDRGRLENAPLLMFVRPADRRLLLDHVRQCRQTTDVVSTELVLRTRVGVEIPVQLSSRDLRTRYGEDRVYHTTAVDLRERLRIEDERRRAEETRRRIDHEREIARAANEAKDRFLAILSHELRAPLTPVLLATSTWKDDESISNPLRQALAMIHRNIAVEAQLIDDLLDLTRIAQNKLSLEAEPVDLHEVVREVTESMRGVTSQADVTVALELESHGWVRGDALRLRQVLTNLLRNAIHHTPPGGRITVGTRDVLGARLQLTVQDTGAGFDEETRARMFEPFDQGSRLGKGGLGLGLAICRGLVEAHRGSIIACSEGAGRGACFTVELPATEARPTILPVEPLVEQPARNGPLRILLVEDHEDTCIALSYVLTHEGYLVQFAHSVSQALAAAEHGEIDMVVSDLGLPDGSGLDLMRVLKARKPVRGIALTGYGRREDLAETRDAGFDRHLTKPVDVPTLIAAIESLRCDAA